MITAIGYQSSSTYSFISGDPNAPNEDSSYLIITNITFANPLIWNAFECVNKVQNVRPDRVKHLRCIDTWNPRRKEGLKSSKVKAKMKEKA